MNMQNNICFLLLLVAPFLCAQKTAVKWGAESEFEKRMKISSILSDKSGNFYIVKLSGKKNKNSFILEKFSSADVSLVKRSALEFPTVNTLKTSFEDLVVIGNRLWLFVSAYDEAGLTQILYAQAINNDLSYNGLPIEADRIEKVPAREKQEFTIVQPSDSRSVMISHNLPFAKYSDEKFSYKVYDSAFAVIWQKELELPYKDRFLKVSSQLVDNEKNIYILSAISSERKKGEENNRSVPDNNYFLLTYSWKENKLKEFDITLGDKWITALSFGLAPNGDIVAGGFYSNSHEQTIAGTFYLRIDGKTHSIVSKNLKAFEKDFLLEFLPERKVKKGKELSDFYFDHFIVREDGSALFVAEQYYMQMVYTYNDPYGYGMYGYGGAGMSPYYSRGNVNYQYYYNDLIVVSVNAEGVIEWARKIPKRQISTNDQGYYLSYALAYNEKGVYVLFNDNAKNTPQWRASGNAIYSMMKTRKSVAMLAYINKSGMINYEALFSAKDSRQVLRPKMHYQSGSQQLIIFSQRGNDYKFGIIGLE